LNPLTKPDFAMNTDTLYSLDNETALITGGGTGIGLGVARCMVKAGAAVVLVGRRESELSKACAELGASASFVVQDITRFEEAPALVQRAEQSAGTAISILVNNAGTHLKKLAVDTTPEEFQAMFNTHVLAAHALASAVSPGMVARGRGSILFMSSMAAFMGVPMVMAYAAAKSAYFGMVSTLSAELSAKGVRVNAIAPGWIFSEMSRKALDNDPERKNKVMSRIQMGRMGSPEDIGWAAVYLCSPAAAYVTGVTLPVDGGAAVGF
jgi:NAD(P)-dependent dehydrogenase (short-subunit alcohol dehydrogenase family)